MHGLSRCKTCAFSTLPLYVVDGGVRFMPDGGSGGRLSDYLNPVLIDSRGNVGIGGRVFLAECGRVG